VAERTKSLRGTTEDLSEKTGNSLPPMLHDPSMHDMWTTAPLAETISVPSDLRACAPANAR